MRRAVVVSLLVLASVLLGALAAGTPVAGNDTVAAVTAGIELGTAPVARAASPAHDALRLSLVRALLALLQLVLAAAALVAAFGPWIAAPGNPRSLLRSQVRQRRGPPALA